MTEEETDSDEELHVRAGEDSHTCTVHIGLQYNKVLHFILRYMYM